MRRQARLKTVNSPRRSRKRKSRKRKRALCSKIKIMKKIFQGKRRRRLRKLSPALIKVVVMKCNDRRPYQLSTIGLMCYPILFS
jgi:hypothetical protein